MKPQYRLRSIWHNMRQRCGNPRDKGFQWYGARGIAVCPEWLQDFRAFEAWALSNGYAHGLSIDRRDNSAGYMPTNCRWTTIKEQERNRRDSDFIEFNGEKKCLAAWAEHVGLSQAALWSRIYKLKWEVARALTTPVQRCGVPL